MNSLDRSRWSSLVLVVLAMLALGLVLLTQGQSTTSERRAREHQLLGSFAEGQVTRIKREAASDSFALVRSARAQDPEASDQEAAWQFEDALGSLADRARVKKLLTSLQYAGFERKLSAPIDRANLGFNDPTWVLHVDVGSLRYRLRLGAAAPAPVGARYLEVTGENVPVKGAYVVSQQVVADLSVEANDFRERQLIPSLSSALDRITIATNLDGKGTLELQRQAGVWYLIEGPARVRADRNQVEFLLASLARFEVHSFLQHDDALSLTEHGREVSLYSTGSEQPVVLRVGSACPGANHAIAVLSVRPPGLAGCVPETAARVLQSARDVYLDHGLFRLRLDEIESLSVRHVKEDLTIEIVREDEGFKLRKPEAASLDTESVQARLEAILQQRGDLANDLRAHALADDVATLEIRVRGAAAAGAENPEERLVVVRGSGGAQVRREADGALLTIDATAALLLALDTSILKSRALLHFDLTSFHRVRIRGSEFAQTLLRTGDGVFVLQEPAGFIADGSLSSALAEELGKLTALAWVSERDLVEFGFDPQRLLVDLSFNQEGHIRSERIIVGRRARGGYYAKFSATAPTPETSLAPTTAAPPSGGAAPTDTATRAGLASAGDEPPGGADLTPTPGGVFILAQDTVDLLTTLVIDRGPFLIRGGDMQSFTLTRQGSSVQFAAHGSGWQPVGTASVRPGEIEGVLGVLETLRPEAAVTVGAPLQAQGLHSPSLEIEVIYRSDPTPRHLRFGTRDVWRDLSVRYARAEGTPATYVVADSVLQPLFGMF